MILNNYNSAKMMRCGNMFTNNNTNGPTRSPYPPQRLSVLRRLPDKMS